MSFTISAPGKIHLIGEHAVVYGYPAILAAINKRIFITVEPQVQGKAFQIVTPYKQNLLDAIFTTFKNAYNIRSLPSIKCTISSQIPIGSGMGSSAAFSSVVLGALMKSVKNIWNPTRINELAYEVEKTAHGNPSGADNTVIVFGGLLWFRKEFDFLKSIWSLPIVQYKIPPFIFFDTGRPKESTKDMVLLVQKKINKNPQKMHLLFADQEQQAKSMLLSLKKADAHNLAISIRNAQKNLEKLGVVSPFAKKLIREIEYRGGVAKICGAGGVKERSGIVLAYFPKDQKSVKHISEDFKIPFFQASLGDEGIRLENNK